MTRIALATCTALPDLDPDDAPLLGALLQRGVEAQTVVWDDPAVDWSAFDLVVIRSTWDYAQRRGEFLEWASRVEAVSTLANPYPVVRWNTDKHYLDELERAGVPVVPTIWLEPERHLSSRALHTRFPAHGDFVIKPAVSAGSVDTGRYTAIDAGSRGLAIRHARRLLEAERTVMVQRYLRSVDTVGERAHVFIAGEYSHSVLKGAMLDGPDVGVDGVYKEERMERITASETEVEVAREVIRVARRLLTASADGVEVPPEPFLYARVDVVSGDEEEPVLMELELVEPSLFTSLGDGALDRFADAIVARAR
ncbi:ATP-grasp domain-containing protein [Actinotalea subterranea]|uniref:ATP-grasp domain-containing protein n=1 Tax=Actinotalea subterranea TaxID=2607497 RepID=UPI0011EE5DC5|nr:hypothetical protein [Actinotalea subterranea]